MTKYTTDICPKTEDIHSITIDYRSIPILNSPSQEYRKFSFTCDFSEECPYVNNCPIYQKAPICITE